MMAKKFKHADAAADDDDANHSDAQVVANISQVDSLRITLKHVLLRLDSARLTIPQQPVDGPSGRQTFSSSQSSLKFAPWQTCEPTHDADLRRVFAHQTKTTTSAAAKAGRRRRPRRPTTTTTRCKFPASASKGLPVLVHPDE